MSGEKCSYVRVEQNEYNRLRNQARRQDHVEQNMRNEINRRTQQMNQELNQRMQQMNQRFAHQENQMAGMSEGVRQFQQETNQRLQRQAQQFHKGLESLQTQVVEQREEYTRLIREQSKNLARELDRHKTETKNQIIQLSETIAKKESNQKQRAFIWQQDTKQFLDGLGQGTRHDKFKPGAIDKLRAELQLAEGNLQQGDNQAAIASSQQSFLRAHELQAELAMLEMEWEAELQVAKQKVAELLSLCEAQKECQFSLDTEEGVSVVDGQIDYWTEGGLKALEQKAIEEAKQLENPKDLSLDELKASIEQSEQWYQQAFLLTDQARDAIIASQLRVDMAERIADTLAESNWEAVDNTYEGEDERKAVHVKFINLQGDEIVTIITPENRGEGIITD